MNICMDLFWISQRKIVSPELYVHPGFVDTAKGIFKVGAQIYVSPNGG